VRAALASIAAAYLRVPPQQPSSARLPGAKASGGPVSYAPDMDVRLVQLLGSFIAARSEYVLARLEFAALHPDCPAPPNIDRLPDASERTLRERWPFAASSTGTPVRFSGYKRSKNAKVAAGTNEASIRRLRVKRPRSRLQK